MFYRFSRNFYFFVWVLDQYWEVLNQLSVKFNSQEVFPEFPTFFELFPSLSQDCVVFLQDFLGSGLFTETHEKKHFRILLILELAQIFIYMLTAYLQLVKVTTVCIFLGRGLLVQESESQEDQYLYEICPFKHFQPFSVFPVFPGQFTACPS